MALSLYLKMSVVNYPKSRAPIESERYLQDCPWFKGLDLYVKLVAGASLTATRLLAERSVDVAICWDGGR